MMKRLVFVLNIYNGSPKVITIDSELENDFIKICRIIHNYSFDLFAHRVTKRKRKLSDIQRYVEQDQTHFTPQQRSMLAVFLQHVDVIIRIVGHAEATKQLSTITIQILLSMYSYWTEHHLLPQDALAEIA